MISIKLGNNFLKLNLNPPAPEKKSGMRSFLKDLYISKRMSDLIPYNKNNNPEDDDEETRARRILLIAVIVFILIIVILTFGWIYWRKEKQKAEEREKKKQRLIEVEALINEIQAKKEKIERTERIIKRWVRIGVGAIIVWCNFAYTHYYIYPFVFENDIGKLINLDTCILFGYSFVAYISYGSIENFVKKLKEILASVLRKNHMHSLEELESLIKERDRLITELSSFE